MQHIWSKKNSDKEKRKSVILRLQAQLESKVKPKKFFVDAQDKYQKTEELVPLESKDIDRIKRELETLSKRV